MLKIFSFIIPITSIIFNSSGQTPANMLTVYADSGEHIISKHIYGQFSEHLGRGIYEGIWVGEDSKIPNTNGIRNDVVAALNKIKVPNLRWPGGCFADEYHWIDGIGEERAEMVNTHWGGVTEDNSFGTHEFMELCRQLNTEPYICGNVGSGTVEEMSDWVEYMTFDGVSPMADLRRKHGQENPWEVRYWGVGNENWGCGGNMRPEYYADIYNRFATYCRNYGDNKLYKIASGSSNDDYNWTEVLMKNIKHHLMDGLSVHYYTINRDWSDKHSATEFDEESYFYVLHKSLRLDEYLTGHTAVMNKYDPDNTISLIVDEWGAWHREEPGSKSGFLYQQNTLRDAFVASLSLNIFHKHCERVYMANIAQTVNVLQAMILTDNEKMILTPTYHAFDMYKGHQEATYLPIVLTSESYSIGDDTIKALYATSSASPDGSINISITNVHPSKSMDLSCQIKSLDPQKVTGRILTGNEINSHNTFDNPLQVIIEEFSDIQVNKGVLTLRIPAKSIVHVKVSG